MTEQIEYLDPDEIKRDPTQPRTEFDEESLQSLARSYKIHGIMDAVEVDENNILIRGERRWRAAKIAGVEVPIKRIVNLSLKKRLERQLIEHHKGYGPVDKAWGYATAVININEEVRGQNKIYTVPEVKEMDLVELSNLIAQVGEKKPGTKEQLPGGTAKLSDILGIPQNTIWGYIQIVYLEPKTQEMIGRESGQIPYTFASAVTRLYPPHTEEKKRVEALLRAGKFEKNRNLLRDLCKRIVEDLHIFEKLKNEETGETEWVEINNHNVVIDELFNDIEQDKYFGVASEERTESEDREDAVVRLNSYVDTYLEAHRKKVEELAKQKQAEERKEADRKAKEAEKKVEEETKGDIEEEEEEDEAEDVEKPPVDDGGKEDTPPIVPPDSPPEDVESDAERLIRETKESRDKVQNKLYEEYGKGKSLEGKIDGAIEKGVPDKYISGWRTLLKEFKQKFEGADLTKEDYDIMFKEIGGVISEIDARKRSIDNEKKVMKKIQEARKGGVPEEEIKKFRHRLDEMYEDASLGNNKQVSELIKIIDNAIVRVKIEKEKAEIVAQAQAEIDDQNLEKAITDDPEKVEKILLWNSTEGLSEEDRHKLLGKAKTMGWSAVTVFNVKVAISGMDVSVRNIVLGGESRLPKNVIIKLSEVEDPEAQIEIIKRIRTYGYNSADAVKLIDRVMKGEQPRETVIVDEVESMYKDFEKVFNRVSTWGYNHYMVLGEVGWARVVSLLDKLEEKIRWLKRKGFLTQEGEQEISEETEVSNKVIEGDFEVLGDRREEK